MRYRCAAEKQTEQADLLKLALFLELSLEEAERCGPNAQPESAPTATTYFTKPQSVTTGGRKPVHSYGADNVHALQQCRT